MAKGDSGKAQNMINTQGPLAQNYLSGIQAQQAQYAQQANNIMYGQPQQAGGDNSQIDAYIDKRMAELPPTKESLNTVVKELNAQGIQVKFATHGANQELESDDKIIYPDGTMNDFINNVGGADAKYQRSYVEGGPNANKQGGGVAGQAQNDYGNIMQQYQDVAKTGGYSQQDLANIRSRAVSPIRSMYSSAKSGIERQRALQGGYSPNYTAAMAKMSREASMNAADATTNAEAGIAEMLHRGKMEGLSGMSGIYGTTPGMANMFGNQALAQSGQGINLAGLQNNLGLGMINSQIQKAGVPSTFSQVMGNINSVVQPVAGIAKAFA